MQTVEKHGHAGWSRNGQFVKKPSPTYKTWTGMIGRCGNPRSPDYMRYGGRGISVHPRWLTFANFLEDMGERPVGMTLDRINNDGPYSPENCRWATNAQQRRNSRQNHLLTFNGKTQPMVDWAAEVGLTRNTLAARIRMGWTVERALTQSVRPWGCRP
jgi:hypothetical protein